MPHLIIIRQGSTASGPATVGVLDAQAFCPPYAVLIREDVDLGPGLRMRRAEPGLHAAKSGIGGDPDLFALKPAKTGRLVSADVIPRLSRMDFKSARGVYVVLDATEIHRDWFLVGLEFQLLRFLIREAGIRAVVPTSVLMEVVANHDREYARARRQLTKVAEGLWRAAGRGALPAPQLPDQSTYQEQLVERLENLGIEFLPWPETPHEEIVKRATERRPPFDEAGSGYRDTLVWMSCLAFAGAGRTVFLVSQDRDFAGRDLDLAGALIKEVTDLSGSVTLVRHLGAWLLTLVPWGDVGDLKEAAANARDEEVASSSPPGTSLRARTSHEQNSASRQARL